MQTSGVNPPILKKPLTGLKDVFSHAATLDKDLNLLPSDLAVFRSLALQDVQRARSLESHEINAVLDSVWAELKYPYSSANQFATHKSSTQVILACVLLAKGSAGKTVAHGLWRLASTSPSVLFPATSPSSFRQSSFRNLWMVAVMIFGPLWLASARTKPILWDSICGFPFSRPGRKKSLFHELMRHGYEAIEVVGDGNCGFYTLLVGLHALSKLPPHPDDPPLVYMRRTIRAMFQTLISKYFFITHQGEIWMFQLNIEDLEAVGKRIYNPQLGNDFYSRDLRGQEEVYFDCQTDSLLAAIQFDVRIVCISYLHYRSNPWETLIFDPRGLNRTNWQFPSGHKVIDAHEGIHCLSQEEMDEFPTLEYLHANRVVYTRKRKQTKGKMITVTSKETIKHNQPLSRVRTTVSTLEHSLPVYLRKKYPDYDDFFPFQEKWFQSNRPRALSSTPSSSRKKVHSDLHAMDNSDSDTALENEPTTKRTKAGKLLTASNIATFDTPPNELWTNPPSHAELNGNR